VASSPLQNRLVGTVIVVALAVIILPDLFGNAGQMQNDEFQVTPLRPSVEPQMQSPSFPNNFSVKGNENTNVIAVPIVEDQIEVREPAEAVELTTATQEPAVPTGERWVIQLGAFRNVDAVNELLAKLRAEGFQADSRVLRRADGPLHLVLVGPDLNEQALISQLEPLKKLTDLEGKVVPYRPAND